MGAGSWFILGCLYLAIMPLLMAPFILSSRISREEEAEDLRRWLEAHRVQP